MAARDDGGMVYAGDLKSPGGNSMRVQVPLVPPEQQIKIHTMRCVFCFSSNLGTCSQATSLDKSTKNPYSFVSIHKRDRTRRIIRR